MGEIRMEKGANPGQHNLKVEVSDSQATVVATVIVNIITIEEDAVMSSGSMTIPGMTCISVGSDRD